MLPLLVIERLHHHHRECLMNRRRLVTGTVVSSVTALGITSTSLAQDSTPAASPDACVTTSPAENTAVARRWYEDVLSGHDLTVLDEILLPDGQHESPPYPGESSRAILEALLIAFPDMVATVEHTVAEGDYVTVRWTIAGTHDGPLQGFDPTGKAITVTGINIFRFECGLIAEVWSQTDIVGLYRQLGLPLDPATPAA
jgi:predicted ester cyclase